MPLEIPGYYFDEEKGKYFKIQKTHLASGSSAAYSADNVKRRRLEDEAKLAVEQRRRLLRNHIRRHPGLQRNRVTAAALDGEIGAASAVGGLGARLMASQGGGDKAEVWAAGLQSKGEVVFAPSYVTERMPNMNCFYVDGGDQGTGMGVAYASLDGETLVGSYVRTDENERITYARDSTHMPHLHHLPVHTEVVRCPQMSSIRYHRPTHRVLMTSRELDYSAGLYIFSPPLSQPGNRDRPQWLLGEADQYQRVSTIRQGMRDQLCVHQATPAPDSASETLCVIGTNAGVLRVSSNETMEWLTPSSPSGPGRRNDHARKTAPRQQVPREIFDLDFDRGNPNVLHAGGRQARLWTTDIRTSGREWSFANIPSSASHVRSLNAREILVSGPCDLLSIYDIRYLSPSTSSSSSTSLSRTTTRPVLTFPSHSNKAHIHTGLDVSSELGVVAAAQDDGTVKIFSTISGRVLSQGGSRNGLGSVKTDTPVKALQFRKMPWERWESLWVAEGPTLKKFSFGTKNFDDEA